MRFIRTYMKKAPWFLLIAFVFTGSLPADTLELKSGKEIEGTITGETADHILIETEFSPTIREERRVPRSDIAKIIKAGPDDEAYQAVATLEPPGTAKSSAPYQKPIADLQAFLEDYDYSRHVQQVRHKLTRFRAEARRIDSGDYKIDGTWVAATDYDAEPAYYEARALLGRMKGAAAAGDQVRVLNLFDQMKKEYKNAESFPAAAELALEESEQLLRSVKAQQASLERKLAQREIGLQRANPNDRARMERAIAQEDRQIERIEAALEKSDATYPPLIPNSKKLLDALAKQLTRLAADIEKLNLADMGRSARLTQQARMQLETVEFEQIETALTEAEAAWPDNAAIDALRKALEERRGAYNAASREEADSVRKSRADQKAIEDAQRD